MTRVQSWPVEYANAPVAWLETRFGRRESAPILRGSRCRVNQEMRLSGPICYHASRRPQQPPYPG